jgi:hypothetical protein
MVGTLKGFAENVHMSATNHLAANARIVAPSGFSAELYPSA